MNAHRVRRSLAFARRDETKVALGWWGLTVHNWCRPHRSLHLALSEPQAKKSCPKRLQWRWGLPTMRGLSATCSWHKCSVSRCEIISH